MIQRILSTTPLVITVMWIVFSHVPSARSLLPTVAFPGGGNAAAAITALCLGIFLAIQLWLLRTTIDGVRSHQQMSLGDSQPIRLNLGLEVLWTGLPIVMTLGLALAAYSLWDSLPAP